MLSKNLVRIARSRAPVAATVVQKSNNYFTYANEPGHPLNRKPKIVSPKEAVACVQPGNFVFMGGAASTPVTLINTLAENSDNLCDITVCHMHTETNLKYLQPEMSDKFRSISLFMGGNVRKVVAEGRGDNMPIFLQDIPKLFKRGIYKPDVAFITVSPIDEHGYCSLGTSVDCVRSAVQHSKLIVAQINKQMPRTFGDAIIHSSHFDFAIEIDTPLPLHPSAPPTPVETKIGKLIAENLVEDGATLQMGIGSIPDAVLLALHNHKDLGIHSEMFANGVVELVAKGCVTNAKKSMHRGRIVGSFLIGDQCLYNFVNNNPFIEMMRVDYVNNTHIISQQTKMTAINSCIEIDLTGQICSDSIGTRFFSGFGGQVDFIRGASEGLDGKGKPIIAMPSTTNKGESKIVPLLKPGAGVVTTRAHVNYVVTEYGIAELFGKTARQRAHALICIAHPDHRECLEEAAFERLKQMPSP